MKNPEALMSWILVIVVSRIPIRTQQKELDAFDAKAPEGFDIALRAYWHGVSLATKRVDSSTNLAAANCEDAVVTKKPILALLESEKPNGRGVSAGCCVRSA